MANEECRRCGAVAENMVKHKRWHRHLEGTDERLAKPDTGDGPGKPRAGFVM